MGTFDVSLLNIDDGVFEVKATAGDTHLGGADFDQRLASWCIDEFCRQNKDIDTKAFKENKRVLGRLKVASERAKKTLSSSSSSSIEVESLFEGRDFRTNITRAKFEQLCNNDFRKCLDPVDKVLKDSKMDKKQITDVVLVGGSTRIPKIIELLRDYFGKEPKKDINPDEAVAYGAAIQAAILTKGDKVDATLDGLVLLDVAPLSLGIEVAGGLMSKLIPRNTTIPCSKEETYSTYSDNQPAVTIKIYEGERDLTKDNNLLGTFELTGIPPMPRGIPKIKVKFDLDTNGILKVIATEESSGKSKDIKIENDKNRFTKEQLEKMVAEAEKMAEEDKKVRERIEAKNELENYLYNVRNSVDNPEFKTKLGDEKHKQINEFVTSGIQWVDENASASKDEFSNKQKELEEQIKPLIMSVYQAEGGFNPMGSTEPQSGPKVEEVDD
ncbi:Heat shock protein 70 [uncultured virus]|nr:Heat shock protein 70 [uncultured virus]